MPPFTNAFCVGEMPPKIASAPFQARRSPVSV